jgi:hypothetical protein
MGRQFERKGYKYEDDPQVVWSHVTSRAIYITATAMETYREVIDEKTSSYELACASLTQMLQIENIVYGDV